MTLPPEGTPRPIIDDAQLSAFLDGDLSPAEEEAVRRAIQTDTATDARYRELAATVSLLRALPSPALPRSFALTADQVRAFSPVPQAGIAARSARLIPLFGSCGAIAAVLLLALIAADFSTGGFKTTAPPRPVSASVEQVTAAPPTPAANAAQAAPRSAAGAPAAPVVTSVAMPASPAPAATGAGSMATRTATSTTLGVPLALVRAIEIALAIIALAGIIGAILSARGRLHQMAPRGP